MNLYDDTAERSKRYLETIRARKVAPSAEALDRCNNWIILCLTIPARRKRSSGFSTTSGRLPRGEDLAVDHGDDAISGIIFLRSGRRLRAIFQLSPGDEARGLDVAFS